MRGLEADGVGQRLGLPSGSRQSLFVAIAVLGTAILTVIGLGLGLYQGRRVDELHLQSRALELLDSRVRFTSIVTQKWTLLAAEPFLPTGTLDHEVEDFSGQLRQVRGQAQARLVELTGEDDSVGREATKLLKDLVKVRSPRRSDDRGARLLLLSQLEQILSGDEASTAASHWTNQFGALHLAHFTSHEPFFLARHYLAALVVREDPRVPQEPWVMEALGSTVHYMETMAGEHAVSSEWEDERTLLEDGFVFPVLSQIAPETTKRMESSLESGAAEQFRQVDLWLLQEASDPASALPSSLAELVRTQIEFGRELDQAVLEAITVALTETTSALAHARWNRGLSFALAGLIAVVGALGVLGAIRRQRRLELRLLAAAETDPLTGLLNRYGLDNQISKFLKTPGMGGHAVLLLDLDRFKAINDAHGHLAGDAVLREVARRCRDLLRSPKTTLTRLGGDELLITLHGLPRPLETARTLAERIQEALQQPLRTSAGELSIGSSIGIATAEGLADLSDLLTEADIALRDAKASGRGSISCFDKPQHREIAQGLSTGQDIRVTCHFQPQVDLRTGKVIGLEALARWTRKDGTLLVAKEWIRIVEQLGHTRRLLTQVVASTAQAAKELDDVYKGRFWINFAPADLTGGRPAEAFLETLEAHELDPSRVGIEIIETAHDFDPERSATVLNKLREAGVLTSIDDFGIGYTPIGHLTSLPLDRVKIDRSVTRDLATNPQSQALARALADICRFLDLELLAEGIETKDELRTLLRLGVRYSQSYLLGRPMPVEELRVWLAEPLCSLGSIDTLPSQVLPRTGSAN